MGFGQSVSAALNNYFNFSGRSRRPEYWYFTLFVFVVSIILALIDAFVLNMPDYSPLSGLFSLAMLIPGLAVSVRRLHDIGRTGWGVPVAFIPLIGIIILIYWACQPGEPQANPYGPPTTA